MGSLLTVIYAVIIFSVIIFVHELGHFLTAKLFDVKVSEFAIGMGPAVIKKQRGETTYSVRAVPIGGFCAMEGENGESDDPRAFGSKSKLKRFIILAAGAFMNLVLGFIVMLVFLGVYNEGGFVSTVIDSVEPDMPAYEAGIQPGDRILSVNGYKTGTKSEIDVYGSFSESYDIEILRGKEKLSFKLIPEDVEYTYEGETYKRKMIGINFKVEEKSFLSVIEYSFRNSVFLGKLVLISLKQLITGAASPSDLSGPVGIINEINTAAQSGLADILYLMALITVNLGLFNLLPLPALDGGRILFIIIEAIIRKPIPPKYEGLCHGIGFILLIALMLYATGNDIIRLFTT